ncbi:hypothetical protein [Alishewanella sp. HL-SH05]|uniref:hypothetical protein n=1 Tax=Alishewanella sp. HL-SH05 TaxID=3461145 RepID=UPI004042CBB4
MKLFDFLALMSEEKYPIRIEYREHMGCIDVEVDAFSERWVVSFDEGGFVDFLVYRDIDAPDNENVKLLSSLINRPQQSWLDAAEDLEILFISPYIFIGSDGQEYQITGLLPQFGGPNGTLITSRKDSEEACFETSKLKGFQGTGLNPSYYDKYDREHVIETLQDWGWNSKEPKPTWYSV